MGCGFFAGLGNFLNKINSLTVAKKRQFVVFLQQIDQSADLGQSGNP